MNRPRVGIIIGTIRQGRFGEKPANWIYELGSRRSDLEFEIVDLRDYPLAIYGDPSSVNRTAGHEDARHRWTRKMAELDAYIFIVAEYNHTISSALKNALDYAYPEFNRKPAAFIGYGAIGAARAVEHLRLILVELQIAPLRAAVHIAGDEFRSIGAEEILLSEQEHYSARATAMLDDLAWWTHVLRRGRDAVQVAGGVLEESLA